MTAVAPHEIPLPNRVGQKDRTGRNVLNLSPTQSRRAAPQPSTPESLPASFERVGHGSGEIRPRDRHKRNRAHDSTPRTRGVWAACQGAAVTVPAEPKSPRRYVPPQTRQPAVYQE